MLFFVSLLGATRDLHSFPTRRSSDLHSPGACAQAEATASAIGRRAGTADLRTRLTRKAGPQGPAFVPGLLARLDRKSTRLNSSHVSISYAVFCLKKKK